ncbi:hypothetical protein [Nodosilinea sp. LEGE 06152]|uniref:hypothetical protein n=1 Tax=Nodosilinea sp. LEGE 06152 TaxID=2777966 RepID=UPI0018810D3C|nr:hypothetical protein [Nodosilinea sp. LEGE 06152]
MTTNLLKLADTVRMAARTYDNGKRETALKLLSIVASKVETSEDGQRLFALVRSDIQNSGIRVYFQSIILGSGGTAVHR